MDKKFIIDTILFILGLVFLTSGGVVFYFVYYYLWKLEKKHGIKIKGRGIFFIDRALCAGVLVRLSMRGPNKPIPREYIENPQGLQNRYASHYVNIPYEDIKIFKLYIYIAIMGMGSALLAILIGEFLR